MASAIASIWATSYPFENNTYRLALDSPNSLEALNQVEKMDAHGSDHERGACVYWDGPMRMLKKGTGPP